MTRLTPSTSIDFHPVSSQMEQGTRHHNAALDARDDYCL
jgi:hypothetical protein